MLVESVDGDGLSVTQVLDTAQLDLQQGIVQQALDTTKPTYNMAGHRTAGAGHD